MRLRISLICPDQHVIYDGHTPATCGVGGGVTARVRLLSALAKRGHQVTAIVNCANAQTIDGVRYQPLTAATRIDADVVIGMTTGGQLSLAPLSHYEIHTTLRVAWIQGVPQPQALDALRPDYVCVASDFLRQVCIDRWGLPESTLFVCYNGLTPNPPTTTDRDPFGLVYIGPPSKGLDASLHVLERLRERDLRFRLDVFGGARLWGEAPHDRVLPPNVTDHGMVNQDELCRRLAAYEYCLAPQSIEEGFGIAVQEAKRAGALVVASAVGAFPELFRQHWDGCLIDGDPGTEPVVDLFAEHIWRLASRPDRRQRMRARAAATPWTWDCAAATWSGWLEDLLGVRSAPIVQLRDGPARILPDGRHSCATGRYLPDVYPASPLLDAEQPRKRVLLTGFYGHGNLGDESILSVLVEQLRDAHPAVDIVVASGHPSDTSASHGVDAVNERDIPHLFDVAASSDVVVLGGGGLLHDHFGLESNVFLTEWQWGLPLAGASAALALTTRTPFVVVGVGVGPLQSPEARAWTRLIVDAAGAVSVRDADSSHTLAQIGATSVKCVMAPDVAYGLEVAPSDHVHSLVDALGWSSLPRPWLMAALRPWPTDGPRRDWERQLRADLTITLDTTPGTLILLPFERTSDHALPDDLGWCEALAHSLSSPSRVKVLNARLTPEEMAGLIAEGDVVLAMRRHAVIFGALAATPVVALEYDPKVRSAMQEIELLDYSLPLDTAPVMVTTAINEALRNAASIRGRLRTVAAALKHTSSTHAAIISRQLSQRDEPAPDAVAWPNLYATALVHHVRLRRQHLSREAALEAQGQQLQRTLDAALGERDRLSRDLAALETQGQQLQRTLDAMVEERDRLSRDLMESLATLETSRAARIEVEQHLSAARASLDVEAADKQRLVFAVRDAQEANNQASNEIRDLHRELRGIKSGRAWALLTLYREWRKRGRAAVSAILSAMHLALRRAGRPLVRVWRKHALMTAHAFAFDRYLRTRQRVYGTSAAGMNPGGQPGLVSVVLPVYNGAAYLAEALESICAQQYPSWELIVVNDGSTDETPRILGEYAARDRRISVITQANQRLPRALNVGFTLACGEFVTWTSADNRLAPDCLSSLVASLFAHPAWDMVYADLEIIGPDGQVLRDAAEYAGYQRPAGSGHVALPRVTDELNLWPNNYVGAAFMYRRRAIALLGEYSPRRFVLEDYDYWMRLNAVLTLRHIGHHRSLYQYRFHPRSLTADWKTHRMLERRDRLMVFERARQDFYLQPMVWILQADPGLSAAVASVGHVVWSLEHPLHALPMHEMPLVYVKAGSALEARQAPSMQVPPQVPSVFVAIDGGTDIHAHAGWHQLITLGEPSEAAVPQRWWRVADLQTLVRTVDIWTKQRALQRLERAAEEPEVTSCKASIIICTNRGDQQVARTLDAVCSQEGCNSYEVILVDNSADGAACAINPVSLLKKDGRVSVRTVKWPAPGLSLARNAGLAAASGAIICFLDDDSVPQPDWLAHVMQAFDTHADVGVVGGHIRLRVPEPRPSAVRPGWEKYWSHFVTGYTEFTTVSHWWEFPWGANWAARRQALREAGGFRSAFGRVGSNYWGGEELVASAVIQRLGYRIGIEPRAEVIHEVQSSRFTFWHVCRTVIAGNLASYAAQRDLYIPRDIGVRSQLRALMTDHWDPTLPTMPSRLASFGARKVGQVAVLAAVAADILRRMRRPAAMRGR